MSAELGSDILDVDSPADLPTVSVKCRFLVVKSCEACQPKTWMLFSRWSKLATVILQ